MPLRLRKILRVVLKSMGLVLVFVITALGGMLGWFHYAPPAKTCGSCHEMQGHIDVLAASAHQGVHCRNCHGGTLTLDVHAMKAHGRRFAVHFGALPAAQPHLSHEQILAISRNCGACHAAVANRWSTGKHSASYKTIFLNAAQNQAMGLNADCLRCHGMLFEGSTQDLVAPMDQAGPWRLLRGELADEPTMPCLGCHMIHTPLRSAAHPSPAAFYVRHEKTHFPADQLPVPVMEVAGKPIATSPDPRQRLCVQCHAPNASHAALSSDDRTPTGKHGGLSCMDCHDIHGTTLLDTCTGCHAGKTISSPQKKVHERPQ